MKSTQRANVYRVFRGRKIMTRQSASNKLKVEMLTYRVEIFMNN